MWVVTVDSRLATQYALSVMCAQKVIHPFTIMISKLHEVRRLITLFYRLLLFLKHLKSEEAIWDYSFKEVIRAKWQGNHASKSKTLGSLLTEYVSAVPISEVC